MIAVESETAKSPSRRAGILPNGLAAWNSGMSAPGAQGIASSSIPF
jgi:hypothetical protein